MDCGIPQEHLTLETVRLTAGNACLLLIRDKDMPRKSLPGSPPVTCVNCSEP
jgi:hypothetical protein